MVSERNPLTGTGVYYPVCKPEAPFAFHAVAARVHPDDYDRRLIYEPQEMVATEKVFRDIWKQGAIFSARERVQLGITKQSSMLFPTDIMAGDDKFVYLSLCEPHSAGYRGYHFAFDTVELLNDGANIGIDDLNGFYGTIADNIGVTDKRDLSSWSESQIDLFAEQVLMVQDCFRYSGYEAVEWLKWVMREKDKYPLNVQYMRYVDRYINKSMHHKYIIRNITTSRESALSNAEVLIRHVLPLSFLSGVIFRKVWFDIDDFIQIYGIPGTEPYPVIDISDAVRIYDRSGFPARCVLCGGWLGGNPFEVEKYSSFGIRNVHRDRMRVSGESDIIRVYTCQECGASFELDNYCERYVGQLEDLEYVPYSW